MYYIKPPGSFLGNWEILITAILLILLVFLFAKTVVNFPWIIIEGNERIK
jgi:hypothetical protein